MAVDATAVAKAVSMAVMVSWTHRRLIGIWYYSLGSSGYNGGHHVTAKPMVAALTGVVAMVMQTAASILLSCLCWE